MEKGTQHPHPTISNEYYSIKHQETTPKTKTAKRFQKSLAIALPVRTRLLPIVLPRSTCLYPKLVPLFHDSLLLPPRRNPTIRLCRDGHVQIRNPGVFNRFHLRSRLCIPESRCKGIIIVLELGILRCCFQLHETTSLFVWAVGTVDLCFWRGRGFRRGWFGGCLWGGVVTG